MDKITLGSLFDGIAGFPCVASWYGIEPVWASEIEAAPMRIASRHFPNMKQLGDITKIHGDRIEPVDIITGGSPCQDLSIAGKVSGISMQCDECGHTIGLSGYDGSEMCPKCGCKLNLTRSGLFMEYIRVLREMQKKTDGSNPRFVIWENVCFHEDTLITCADGYKRIRDVGVGDLVKTHTGRYMPVMKVHQTKGQHVMELKTCGSESIIVTHNHPIFARKKLYNSKKNVVGYSDPEWIPASSLTKDHLVGYRLDVPTLPDDFMTEEEAWAVGRWLADGSVDLKKSNPRIFISVGYGKEQIARDHLYKLPYSVYENKPHKTATNFCFTSHEFWAFISDAGIGAGNKRVPNYVFNLPIDLQKCVLDGYLSGDGYIKKNNQSDANSEYYRMTASTASRQLAYGVARIIWNVYHVPTSIFVDPPKDSNIDGRVIKANYPTYKIFASINSTSKLGMFDENYVWQRVTNVQSLKKYNNSIQS